MPDRQADEITFQSILVKFRPRQIRAIRFWVSKVIRKEGNVPGRIAFYFCSDESLLQINRKYLGHDTLTDIITFDYTEDRIISGEVYISIDRVRENANSFGVAITNELHRVIIHGILHLCGYVDKTPLQKARMTEKEDFCLSLRSF